MQSYIAMGIFAFLVGIISLLRLMSDREFYRLTSMKRVWGRSRGLALHFLSNVALPLVCGVVFLTGGISGVKLVKPLIAETPFHDATPSPASVLQDDRLRPLLADTYTSMS